MARIFEFTEAAELRACARHHTLKDGGTPADYFRFTSATVGMSAFSDSDKTQSGCNAISARVKGNNFRLLLPETTFGLKYRYPE